METEDLVLQDRCDDHLAIFYFQLIYGSAIRYFQNQQ